MGADDRRAGVAGRVAGGGAGGDDEGREGGAVEVVPAPVAVLGPGLDDAEDAGSAGVDVLELPADGELAGEEGHAVDLLDEDGCAEEGVFGHGVRGEGRGRRRRAWCRHSHGHTMYKSAKVAFVSGTAGSSLLHVGLLSLAAPVCPFLSLV